MSSPSESLLVFSDVHLGSDLDDRGHNAPRRSASVDRDLVALLAHYRKAPPEADRWRVVIAGDFIDFIGMAIESREPLETALTAEEELHGLGSASDHGREKLRRVAERHADVFAELAAFVAGGHALTIIHGNHDIEFHWDAVKDDFRAILLSHAGDVDAEAFNARVDFNPWFFWRDGVAFIEHGHQYDPFCATPLVMSPLSPLDPRRIARGFCEVLLRYVVRPTRGMTEGGHEHVGLVHYVRFGVKLGLGGMAALGMRFVRAVGELFTLRSALFTDAAKALRAEHDKRVAKLASATRIGIDRLRALLALQSEPVTASLRGILASLLLDRLALGIAAVAAVAAFAAAGFLHRGMPLGCIPVLVAWAFANRWLSRQRSVDPTARMADRATHLARLFPAAFIVMGHTHVPGSVRAGDATYINLGSWAEHETEPEVAARTHLVIHMTPTGPEASFCAWDASGPRRFTT